MSMSSQPSALCASSILWGVCTTRMYWCHYVRHSDDAVLLLVCIQATLSLNIDCILWMDDTKYGISASMYLYDIMKSITARALSILYPKEVNVLAKFNKKKKTNREFLFGVYENSVLEASPIL